MLISLSSCALSGKSSNEQGASVDKGRTTAANAMGSSVADATTEAKTPASSQSIPINIATFDSGFGGFFTAKSIESASRDLTEHYNTVITIRHYGDTKNAPYGEKTAAEIAQLSTAGVIKALSHGADKVFIACNAASTQYNKIKEAVDAVYPGRGRDVIPIVDVSVAKAKSSIDQRLLHNDEVHFAILAAPATVMSMAYPRQLAALYKVKADEQPVNVFSQPRWFKAKGEAIESGTQRTTLHLPNGKTIHIYQMAPGNWGEMIERGAPPVDKSQAVKRDMKLLFDLLPGQAKLDVIGYFCTHYPALDEAIRHEVEQHNYSHAESVYIKQGPLMADLFKDYAETKLKDHQRQQSLTPSEREELKKQSQPVIEITGDNVDATRELTEALFPGDPVPVIIQKP